MSYAKIILTLLIFLCMQVMGGFGVVLIMDGAGAAEATGLDPDIVASMSILSGLLSIFAVKYGLKTINLRQTVSLGTMRSELSKSDIKAPAVLLALLGTTSALFGANLLNEIIPLPDNMEEPFTVMAARPLGILSICVVAPFVEELIFREGIAGYMLRHGAAPLSAIICSSAAFGLMHLNPAQIPFAFLIGLVLAVLYWRTRSIWLPLIMHIINNTMAVVLMNTCDEELSSLLGLSLPATITLTVLSIAASVALLTPFCRSGRNASAGA
ncbi:MAG: CPBP family intramembrane metalloprotease [Bacteroidales bacterium]|nr:CPBP family intramembrane metalloprotease [Candidatus Physcousia equi]